MFRQGNDEPLLHQARKILRERVMWNTRHRDAFTGAGFLAGQCDLQRAGDDLRIFTVGFVEVADTGEQDRFGMPGLHSEVLFQHRRVLGQVYPPNAFEMAFT